MSWLYWLLGYLGFIALVLVLTWEACSEDFPEREPDDKRSVIELEE